MSFFPHSFVADNASSTFHPLFRLLDDFDAYSRGGQSTQASHQPHRQRHVKSFAPRFDVQEKEEVYELHGELPGIEQQDVEIEFTDHQTLSIRGHQERSSISGNADAAPQSPAAEPSASPSLKATVEEETNETDGAQETSTDQQVVKANDSAPVQQKAPQSKYWVSERSVGDFSRSFTFPVRVDQDNVTASMKNGVLSIVVPKLKKAESRKIEIS